MLKMELEYENNILFVRLKGNLNYRNCYKINNYLNPVIKKHNIKYLIYNWLNLNAIDSSGIDAILNSKCFIKNNKGKIRICATQNNWKSLGHNLRIPLIKEEKDAYKLVGVC